MAKKKPNRCILIVCEGTRTESDYFSYIADNISCKNKIWDKVDIANNNNFPRDYPVMAPTDLGKRSKRKFVNPNKTVIDEINVLKELCLDLYGLEKGYEIYEESKAVPLRFVKQAQLLEQKNNMYDELWAVFDKNGHSHHKEAFTLAQADCDGKKVNIGFSSRSFEQWILLHFVKSKKEFHNSECKDTNGRSINCNINMGCKGELCLMGYIRKNTPLSNFNKSNKKLELDEIMSVLMSATNLTRAFENAEWLRNEIIKSPELKSLKCYELNPYVDVDMLVRRLVE